MSSRTTLVMMNLSLFEFESDCKSSWIRALTLSLRPICFLCECYLNSLHVQKKKNDTKVFCMYVFAKGWNMLSSNQVENDLK